MPDTIYIYVMELKVDGSAENALEQINDSGCLLSIILFSAFVPCQPFVVFEHRLDAWPAPKGLGDNHAYDGGEDAEKHVDDVVVTHVDGSEPDAGADESEEA